MKKPLPSAAHRPFSRSLIVILVAWSIGLGACWLLFSQGLIELDGSLLVSVVIGSGLIAVAATIPGLVRERISASGADPTSITIGFFAGVAIRLIGTVALAAMCSYQSPAAKEYIAGMTLAWYVYLTTIEVITFAVLLPHLDRPAVARRQNAKPSIQ